jgi:iron complex transport system substrate-binding protein
MIDRRNRITVWLAVVGLGLCGGCGREAKPSARPAVPVRIASLTLATDEILAELVPLDRVVCVTALADDPENSNVADRYPTQVQRLRDVNLERILALAPDLVCVAPYNTADSLRLLERSGLSIYRNEALHSLDEIEAGVRSLGERVREPGRARVLVEAMQARRRQLADRLRDLPHRPRVLYWSAGFTAGRATTVDDIIRESGGVNVAAELGFDGSPEISPERVVAVNPEVVLLARWKAGDDQGSIRTHPILRRLEAVRDGRLVIIDGRFLTSLSPSAVEGAERLAHALHPDRFLNETPR